MTYQDLLVLPEDGKRHEILDGDARVTPPPGPLHQEILLALASLLRDFVRSHDLGRVIVAPCDVVLDSTNVFQPDLMFVSKPRLAIVGSANVSGPPDLVVEVLSPSTAKFDRSQKLRAYEKHGISSYWILDPELRELEERVLMSASYSLVATLSGTATFEPRIFPELRLELGSVWA